MSHINLLSPSITCFKTKSTKHQIIQHTLKYRSTKKCTSIDTLEPILWYWVHSMCGGALVVTGVNGGPPWRNLWQYSDILTQSGQFFTLCAGTMMMMIPSHSTWCTCSNSSSAWIFLHRHGYRLSGEFAVICKEFSITVDTTKDSERLAQKGLLGWNGILTLKHPQADSGLVLQWNEPCHCILIHWHPVNLIDHRWPGNIFASNDPSIWSNKLPWQWHMIDVDCQAFISGE